MDTRRMILASGLALVFGLAMPSPTAPSPPSGQNPRSLVGKKAPEIKVENWLNTAGKPLSLAKLKGKVVVLDFWAFW